MTKQTTNIKKNTNKEKNMPKTVAKKPTGKTPVTKKVVRKSKAEQEAPAPKRVAKKPVAKPRATKTAATQTPAAYVAGIAGKAVTLNFIDGTVLSGTVVPPTAADKKAGIDANFFIGSFPVWIADLTSAVVLRSMGGQPYATQPALPVIDAVDDAA